MSPPAPDRLTHDAFSARVAAAAAFVLMWFVVAVVACVPNDAASIPARTANVWGFVGGLVAGWVVLPILYWHPFRALGFIPPAATLWFAVTLYGSLSGHWVGWAHGLLAGLIIGMSTKFAGRFGFSGWGRAALVAAAAFALMTTLIPARATLDPVCGNIAHGGVSPWLPVPVGLLALFAWLRLFRPLFELGLEPPLWASYAVRASGPGVAQLPTRGPCLVVANHACWFDPVFLGKVLPRPLTPMMTSKFYDTPALRWLARSVFGVIRVPEKSIKHDPQELREAVAALDRGECVVVFPEGFLRRKEEQPLRRFGQGIWQVLKARPDTPVVAVWIEGAWGSYTSYLNGPPTKGKRLDRRRRLGVGVSAPITVPAETLANGLATRMFLMNEVAAARRHLGLPELPRYELPAKDDETGA